MAFSSDYVVEEIREETQERREDTEACASRPSSRTEKLLESLLRSQSEMENRLTQGQSEMEDRLSNSQLELAKSTASELQKLTVGTAAALNELGKGQEEMSHRIMSLETSRPSSRRTSRESSRTASPNPNFYAPRLEITEKSVSLIPSENLVNVMSKGDMSFSTTGETSTESVPTLLRRSSRLMSKPRFDYRLVDKNPSWIGSKGLGKEPSQGRGPQGPELLLPQHTPRTLESYFDELREGDLIQPGAQPSETGPEDESRRQKQLTQLIKPPLELAHQEISLGRFEEDHSRVTSAMSPRGIVESRSHIGDRGWYDNAFNFRSEQREAEISNSRTNITEFRARPKQFEATERRQTDDRLMFSQAETLTERQNSLNFGLNFESNLGLDTGAGVERSYPMVDGRAERRPMPAIPEDREPMETYTYPYRSLPSRSSAAGSSSWIFPPGQASYASLTTGPSFNPSLNPSFNPAVNSMFNPSFNPSVNSLFNPTVYPQMQPSSAALIYEARPRIVIPPPSTPYLPWNHWEPAYSVAPVSLVYPSFGVSVATQTPLQDQQTSAAVNLGAPSPAVQSLSSTSSSAVSMEPPPLSSSSSLLQALASLLQSSLSSTSSIESPPSLASTSASSSSLLPSSSSVITPSSSSSQSSVPVALPPLSSSHVLSSSSQDSSSLSPSSSIAIASSSNVMTSLSSSVSSSNPQSSVSILPSPSNPPPPLSSVSTSSLSSSEMLQSSSSSSLSKEAKNPLRLPIFDGKGSLQTFLQRFHLCRQFNNWNDSESYHRLAFSLVDGPAELLWSEELGGPPSVDALVEKLQQSYGTQSQISVYRAQLMSKRQGQESLENYLREVQRLASLAFPGKASKDAEIVVINVLIAGLSNRRLAMKLTEMETTTIQQTIQLAIKYNSFQVAEMQRSGELDRHRPKLQTVREVESDSTVRDMERRLAELEKGSKKKVNTTAHRSTKPAPCLLNGPGYPPSPGRNDLQPASSSHRPSTETKVTARPQMNGAWKFPPPQRPPSFRGFADRPPTPSTPYAYHCPPLRDHEPPGPTSAVYQPLQTVDGVYVPPPPPPREFTDSSAPYSSANDIGPPPSGRRGNKQKQPGAVCT